MPGAEFEAQGLMHTIEWLRLPGVFIGLGVVCMVLATDLTFRAMSANPPARWARGAADSRIVPGTQEQIPVT